MPKPVSSPEIAVVPIVIRVPGRPVPWQTHRGNGRHAYADPDLRAWQQVVALYARRTMGSRVPLGGPVRVQAAFTVCPVCLRGGRPPDRTNLLKAAEDALNGIVYADDTQVVGGDCTREFGEDEGVVITVESVSSEG